MVLIPLCTLCAHLFVLTLPRRGGDGICATNYTLSLITLPDSINDCLFHYQLQNALPPAVSP